MPHRESQKLADLIPHASLISSRGRIIAANSKMSSTSGYSKRELLGKRTMDLVIIDDPSRDMKLSPKRSGLPLGTHNIALVKKNGQRVSMQLVAKVIRENHRSNGVLALFEEATEKDSESICLPDNDRMLEECLQVSEAGVLAIASNGLVALASRKCCQLLGYEEYEIIGRNWASILVTQRSRRRAREYFDKLISEKVRPLAYYEAVMPTKGGQQRIVAWHNAILLRDDSGDIMGFIASILDITEQKKALETLEDRERLYRLVSENVTAGVWTFDLTSRKVTYMSPSIAHITGFTGEEVTYMDFELRLTPASLKYGVSELERELALDREYHGRPHSWTLELEEYRKDGSTVWVESRTSVIRDAQGQPTGIFGVTRDITERKRAEKSLLESERRYRTLFENSIDAISIISRNGKVLDVNQAALDLLGYSREEISSLNLKDIAPGRQRLEFQQRIEKFGHVRNFGMKMRRHDGVDLDCLLNFDLRRDDYGNIVGYQGSIRDITEYQRLQENIHLYINEVAKAQEEERLRLSRELHDGVLQDLLALALKVEQAIRGEGRPREGKVGQLQDIRDEVNRLAKDMRSLSHALRPSVLDQLGLVAAVQTLLANIAEATGIKTDMKVLGVEHRLDRELELALFRIAQEALNNVRQHSEARSVKVQIHFGADSMKVVVSDDGKGFNFPKQLSYLASTGKLGMIGMEERAKILGGNLSICSKPNAGTSITVETPYMK